MRKYALVRSNGGFNMYVAYGNFERSQIVASGWRGRSGRYCVRWTAATYEVLRRVSFEVHIQDYRRDYQLLPNHICHCGKADHLR